MRTTPAMPTTGTNKIVKRQLSAKWLSTDPVFVRDRGASDLPHLDPRRPKTPCAKLERQRPQRFLDL